jgi:glutamate 5-kinase
MKIWNLSSKPKSVDFLQALSASGQIGLINNYQKEFKRFNLIAAQVLLSHSDFGVKSRSENAKNSISNLMQLGAIPIINENDSISTEEILNGDNDRLSGKVATLLRSKKLFILTDQNGLYDRNPDQNRDAELINNINLNKFDLKSISFGDSGILGRGGMTTKIKAARDYLNKNNEVWILNGNHKGIIEKVIQKKPLGTKIYLA